MAYFFPQNILRLKWFVHYQLDLPRSCVWSRHFCPDSPSNTLHCHQGHFPWRDSPGHLLTQKSPGISLLIRSTISQLLCPNWPAWVLLGRGTVLLGFCKHSGLDCKGKIGRNSASACEECVPACKAACPHLISMASQ